jgi:uncharacterized protein YjeT (DUF2065 family)
MTACRLRPPQPDPKHMDAMSQGSPLLLALGLVLIIEGLLPFVSPVGWRETMRRIAELRDGQIRFVGLGAVVLGLLLVLIAQ